MPDSNYPREWWRYCTEHDNWDSNGDGVCRVYGTAAPEMRVRLEFCDLLGHGEGRPPRTTQVGALGRFGNAHQLDSESHK